MNEKRSHRWIARRADRLEVFKGDPPAVKIQALRIIELGETTRFAIRLLLVAVTGVLVNYCPALAGWLTVSVW